jgi:hypothetical protein
MKSEHHWSVIQILPVSKFCFILLATEPWRRAIAALTLHHWPLMLLDWLIALQIDQGQSCKSRGKVAKAATLAASAALSSSALASSTASTTLTASAGTFATRPLPLLFGSTATVTNAMFAFCPKLQTNFQCICHVTVHFRCFQIDMMFSMQSEVIFCLSFFGQENICLGVSMSRSDEGHFVDADVSILHSNFPSGSHS